MTTNRLPAVACAALLALSVAPFANVASAMPAAGARAISNAAPANVETVQWRGRGWRGGGWRGGGWGVGAGLVGGAIIGGALASPYYYGASPYGAYYGSGPYYGGPGYVAPPGDGVAYCMQRFRSYDPGSGTYVGFDGLRHPCP